ncbi:hypothetical protein HGRIS_009541 [Hohenbuehelia grisea]|uniref:Argonaute-like protein n=1 Tax=Hohenbuehelia grisea TaxID=104357 RepID=A0ABR3J1W2_9AGAR
MASRGSPGGRGATRGAPRGGSGGRGRGRGIGADIPVGLPTSHITTVGVRRPHFGTAGRSLPIYVNSFAAKIPEAIIHHYDGKRTFEHSNGVSWLMLSLLVVISPSEKTLPQRLNMDLIKQLQNVVAPQIFVPRAVYDGRKNLFAATELPFGDSQSQEFDVSLADPRPDGGSGGGRGPRVYKIRLTKVAEINPELLHRFIAGEQSHDNNVLTAITALNVIIRMAPTSKYPFNVRSFFTNKEVKDIGSGLELWRGYFQSIRPGQNKMLINIDISTGTMYKSGSLLRLCLDFLGKQDPNVLSTRRGFPDRERLRLQRFISGIRIVTNQPTAAGVRQAPRVVKKVTTAGAKDLSFTMREGGTMTVDAYFRQVHGRPLQFPEIVCVEVGSGALIPLELCTVPPGQIMRKQVPPEKTKQVLEFATKKPQERLNSIRQGLEVLDYGQSEYLRAFNMHVDISSPLRMQARVLPPPKLKYGPTSKQPTITPANGSWNMVDKRFFRPVTIERWVIVIYERRERFNDQAVRDMINGLIASCREVGITIGETDPTYKYENGQGRIADQLKSAGNECRIKHGGKVGPRLIVVILPEGGNDIYTAVKHFGDVTMGVATQCLKSSKCFRAKAQYYANVCLKINVKLGGINLIPDPASAAILVDPHNPTIVMGADVIHPAPGSDGRPSFTALVGNVDSNTAKYIAECRVQTSRQEMIDDLEDMSKKILSQYMRYRAQMEGKPTGSLPPKRIIFYRDGVSEGQFQQVLDLELPRLRNACRQLKINPKITVIVVGKRHHIRLFPQSERDGDRSGNCPAGTVVDREIAHPTEFDFYLQSHGGLLGTSRPAHYSVLLDETGFRADELQSLSFTLCHVYARSTRSVSIPAPVYYADIVCSRAKNHYDPQPDGTNPLDLSDTATSLDQSQADQSLDAYKRGFRPLNRNQEILMYFS